MSEWAFWLLFGLYIFRDRLPFYGIHWGGSATEHPGWWWLRSQTVYVKRLGQPTPPEVM